MISVSAQDVATFEARASPYCRLADTADHASDAVTVDSSRALHFSDIDVKDLNFWLHNLSINLWSC
jgi:hypothetical protein